MKTFKQRTIEAVKGFIDMKYKLSMCYLFFGPEFCPLCSIYRIELIKGVLCDGCINNVFFNFPSFKSQVGCNHSETYYTLRSFPSKETRDRRRKFWELSLPEIKKVPQKYFTPSGFRKKPFKFMLEIEKKLLE